MSYGSARVLVLSSVLLWVGIGLAAACVHALMLRRAVDRVSHLEAKVAGRRLAWGAPLRVLAWSPVLLVAARAGLAACVALIVGTLIGRWLMQHRYLRACEEALTGPGTRGERA